MSQISLFLGKKVIKKMGTGLVLRAQPLPSADIINPHVYVQRTETWLSDFSQEKRQDLNPGLLTLTDS